MPRNAQGLYTLPAGNPVTPGTIIESVWANDTMQDLADAMTGSLPRNGSAPMTGPLTLNGAAPTNSRHAVDKAYVDRFMAYSSGMPVGSVSAFGGTVAPVGWLRCDGQAVSRTVYSDLFDLIGTTYGSGDNTTTFNVPDLRNEFIRGRADARAVGSKQAASFAGHVHALSDPGHAHAQAAHSHTITTGGHNHQVQDPGHSHSQSVAGTPGEGFAWGIGSLSNGGQTGSAGTGISLGAAGNLGGNTDSQNPAVQSSVTGISVGAAGGAETVPQNMALDYYIKAVHDSEGTAAVTSVDTSDPDMISVDNTNPVAPELVIHSNVPFGIPKLDAQAKILVSQLPTSTQQLLGYFDASTGNNPSEEYPASTFNSGDTFIVSVAGTILVVDPVTNVEAMTPVLEGSLLMFLLAGVTSPEGWYYSEASPVVTASEVSYLNVSMPFPAQNVQDAITQLSNIVTTDYALQSAMVAADTMLNDQIVANFDETTKQTGATGASLIATGTTAERPNPVQIGAIRFNEDTNVWEGWDGTQWVLVANTGTPVEPPIAAGTRMLFAQATAPDGWTQVTDDGANNRMLRVVSGAGGGVGGVNDPILMNVVPAHTHAFGTSLPDTNHTHSGATAGANVDHSHAIGDPGHAHSEQTMGGSGGWAWGQGGAIVGATTGASGTGIWTGGFSTNHAHAFDSGTVSAWHAHSGSTDNGSSQANWTPRYLDMIVCQKD